MVEHAQPKGLTEPEIAERYGRSRRTVERWRQSDDFPAPVRTVNKWMEYDPAEVDAWVEGRYTYAPVKLEARRLYTGRELEDAGIGITYSTIRADLQRGRWPAPDDVSRGNRWLGATVMEHLGGRRKRNK